MASSLPPSVHLWVRDNLKKATDVNKDAVQAEIRSIIAKAFTERTLATLDWPNIKLASLESPSLSTAPSTPLKRKAQDDTPNTHTSNKKIQLINSKASVSTAKPAASYNVFAQSEAIRRREERFAREHAIERARQNGTLGYGNSTALTPNPLVRRLGVGKKPWQQAEEEPIHDPNVIDWDRYTIVGKSTTFFKNYLRLTSEPDPNDIRPLPILQETLTKLTKRWKKNEVDYNWICDQFKSLRQYLTVQRIKNDFTVKVYEIHARIALESSDLVEFNQCQATLRTLYSLGLQGKNDEFLAYRILYLLHGRNRADLNILVSQLTPQEKATQDVRHAIAVHLAMATGNYHKFFVLYANAPNMGAYIMDHYVDRERCAALVTMSKSYRTLPASYLFKELWFEQVGYSKLFQFLTDHSASNFANPNAPERDRIVVLQGLTAQIVAAQATKYTKINIRGRV